MRGTTNWIPAWLFPSNPSNIHRRLEAQDHLRRRQAEVAAQRRAELAAQKAALLQARIDRGVRVRRAQQLRTERLAAQKADEREAATEAARRLPSGHGVLILLLTVRDTPNA